MTRSKRSPTRRVGAKRRNFAAILISFATVSVLYFNFDPTPAGGDIGEEVIDLSAVTANIDLPTAAASSGDSGPSRNSAGNSLQGKTALLMNVMLLERGIKTLEKSGSHSATFYKQELVDGKMLDGQVMKLKVRNKPFSVYMKWVVGDKGRELLYVDGQNSGKMLIKLGGVKGRLIPTLKLTPTGATAMEESRHPVTEIGLLNLAKQIIEIRQADMRLASGVTCRMFDNQTVNDRTCFCFIVEYANEKISNSYRKSVIFVDKETHYPICFKNFTWPEAKLAGSKAKVLDANTLIEDYRYSNIRVDEQLADNEFDRANSKYRLRR